MYMEKSDILIRNQKKIHKFQLLLIESGSLGDPPAKILVKVTLPLTRNAVRPSLATILAKISVAWGDPSASILAIATLPLF